MKDWHKKPPPKVRSVEDALKDAERQRAELPHVVQVYARDWDKVILADEIHWLRKLMTPNVQVRGVCGSCAHRGATGHCQSEKLAEDWGQSEAEKADMLIYDYSESGGFWVGERFGCVHHTHNAKVSGDGTASAGLPG